MRPRKRKDVVIFFFFVFDEETGTTVPVPVDDMIEDNQELEFFFNDNVRKVWHKQEEEWYLSIADVVSVLTGSRDVKQYIKKMRQRDPELNSKWGTICTPVAMPAADGKLRRIQAGKIESIFRLIQSIPSKKAEPFKMWLAQVGKDRLDEIADPELAFERMIRTYRAKGYSEKWIQQRLRSIDVRKMLTDEWARTGASQQGDFAELTNILTHAWSGKTVKQYKQFKHLHKESLRDNMTSIELAFNQLAEVSATALSKTKNPNGMRETRQVAREGGSIAGNARKELESKLGRSILSPLNAEDPDLLDENYDE